MDASVLVFWARRSPWLDVKQEVTRSRGLLPQVYFQRVLSSRSPGHAQLLSFAASAGCIISAVPACIIGAVAKATGNQLEQVLCTWSCIGAPLVTQCVPMSHSVFLKCDTLKSSVVYRQQTGVRRAMATPPTVTRRSWFFLS